MVSITSVELAPAHMTNHTMKLKAPSAPPLNLDVIDAIFENMEVVPSTDDSPYFNHWNNGGSRRNLHFYASLSLVCRDWLVPSRRLLYRIIPDLGRPSAAKFLHTIREVEAVRKYVRRLYICLDDQVIELADLLPNCMVYLLRSRHDNTIPEALAQVESLGGIHIKDFPWQAEIWSSAFTRWNLLQDMRLHVSAFAPSFPPVDDEKEYGVWLPSLRTLKLTMLERWTLPPTSINTLHTLVIHSYTPGVYETMFLNFIRRHSESLRRVLLNGLEFEGRDDGILDTIGTIAPHLTQLYIHRASRHVTEKVFDTIPLSAVEISVDLRLPVDVEKCVAFLERRKKGSTPLKSLALRLGGAQSLITSGSKEDWVKVEQIAHTEKVEFSCDHDRPDAEKWAVGCEPDRYPSWSKF